MSADRVFPSGLDGDENTVVEVEAERVPTGPSNPHGNAHGTRQTIIESENHSGRDIKSENARYWKVLNRSKKNAAGGIRLCLAA